MKIDGILIIMDNGQLSPEELRYYIAKVRQKTKKRVKKIIFSLSEHYMDVRYAFYDFPLERICRVPLVDDTAGKKIS